MPWTSHDCPVCGEEVRIHVTAGEGGYPEEVVCECDDWESQCGCHLTEAQIASLEEEAIEKADWSPPEPY